MGAVKNYQPLNESQLFLLQAFAMANTEQERNDITSLYLNYIQQKIDAETDKWWTENEMNDEKIEEILNSHYRTPYK